jgi:hypothetical protein
VGLAIEQLARGSKVLTAEGFAHTVGSDKRALYGRRARAGGVIEITITLRSIVEGGELVDAVRIRTSTTSRRLAIYNSQLCAKLTTEVRAFILTDEASHVWLSPRLPLS